MYIKAFGATRKASLKRDADSNRSNEREEKYWFLVFPLIFHDFLHFSTQHQKYVVEAKEENETWAEGCCSFLINKHTFYLQTRMRKNRIFFINFCSFSNSFLWKVRHNNRISEASLSFFGKMFMQYISLKGMLMVDLCKKRECALTKILLNSYKDNSLKLLFRFNVCFVLRMIFKLRFYVCHCLSK